MKSNGNRARDEIKEFYKRVNRNKRIYRNSLELVPLEEDQFYKACKNLKIPFYDSNELLEDAFIDTTAKFAVGSGFNTYRYNLDNNNPLIKDKRFKNFFFTTYIHKVIDIFRTEKRHREALSIDGVLGSGYEKNIRGRMYSYKTNPVEIAIHKETTAKLQRNHEKAIIILDTLRPKMRDTMKLNLQGKSQKDIAEIMEIPIGTVKSRLFAVAKQIEEQMT